jgi:hypothetical protein
MHAPREVHKIIKSVRAWNEFRIRSSPTRIWVNMATKVKSKTLKKNKVDGKPRCGLCGGKKLTKTECCGQWICDDEDKKVNKKILSRQLPVYAVFEIVKHDKCPFKPLHRAAY